MEYEQDHPKLVPCFDEFYGTVLRVVPFCPKDGIRALDLGAGTGLLAAMVAQAFPNAIPHLTDISEPMLAQARVRFGHNLRVTYAVQEHLQLAARSEYDLVLSALSIHHLQNDEKRVLFRLAFDALRHGGVFINADQSLVPSLQGEEQYEAHWLEDVKANGISKEALAKARRRMQEDKNALLTDQLMWLSEAGFDEVDWWYKRFRFVVFGGKKLESAAPPDKKHHPISRWPRRIQAADGVLVSSMLWW